MTDKLATFMDQLLGNSGSFNLLEPKEPVQGMFYLYLLLSISLYFLWKFKTKKYKGIFYQGTA
jgi:hypothetical protein